MMTLTRHRTILIGVVTVCMSLLFLYNNSSANTPDNQNQSDEHQMEDLRQQTSYLEGYSSFIDQKPFRMHCKCCALVTSSGHMIGSDRGAEIDQTECVIRMNDAPTQGHQQDVGQRTSLRVVAHSSMQHVLRNHHKLFNSSLETFFIFWGPGNYMRWDSNLHLMKQMMPKLQVYIISRLKMLQLDKLFKKETGKDRRGSNSWLSTGWFTMAIAIEICDRINIYGMIPPEFCTSSNPELSVPYHYYEPAGPDECTTYLSHEQGRHGGHHRFITEKRVFANWARMFNIHFYQPDWRPADVTQNHTAS